MFMSDIGERVRIKCTVTAMPLSPQCRLFIAVDFHHLPGVLTAIPGHSKAARLAFVRCFLVWSPVTIMVQLAQFPMKSVDAAATDGPVWFPQDRQ